MFNKYFYYYYPIVYFFHKGPIVMEPRRNDINMLIVDELEFMAIFFSIS